MYIGNIETMLSQPVRQTAKPEEWNSVSGNHPVEREEKGIESIETEFRYRNFGRISVGFTKFRQFLKTFYKVHILWSIWKIELGNENCVSKSCYKCFDSK